LTSQTGTVGRWRYSSIQFASLSQGEGGRLAQGFGLITRDKDLLPFVQDNEWAQGSFWTARRIHLTKIRSPDCPDLCESLYWLHLSDKRANEICWDILFERGDRCDCE